VRHPTDRVTFASESGFVEVHQLEVRALDDGALGGEQR
jgi:hypothetical protein